MPTTGFRPVPHGKVESFGPDAEAEAWLPGDFLLTHGEAWTSKVIRFGQKLRIHGKDRRYTHWNHAALVVSEKGEIIEALGRGVVRRRASVYKPREYTVVHVDASDEDRAEAVNFAEWCVANHERYGFVTILSIAYTLLTGGKFSFDVDGTEICSGLVARSQERAGAIFSREPSHVMPADLAKYYEVPLPVDAG